jgi:putative membrane protein
VHLLVRFFVNAIVLGLIISLVPGFHNNAGAIGFSAFGVGTILILALIFGLVNMLIGPILRLVGAPITWLTHGLFQVVINWILLALAVWITPNVRASWLPELIGAVIMTLVGTAITMMWPEEGTVTPTNP